MSVGAAPVSPECSVYVGGLLGFPAHADREENHLRQLSGISATARTGISLHLRLLKVCFSSEHGLFSWTPVILLAVIGLFLLQNRDRALSAVLRAGIRGLSLRHRMLRGLGRHFFLRQSFFCFADAAIHFGPGCVLRLARRSAGKSGARTSCAAALTAILIALESGPDLSVGHASDSGARTDFLA